MGNEPDKDVLWIIIVCFIGISAVVLKKNNDLKASSGEIKYVHGAILDKSLDTRTDERKLVYRNDQKKVFIIDEYSLWDKAEVGDSVKIGFVESRQGRKYKLFFKSIEVIGKAKRAKDITVFSSSEPQTDKTIIIPMLIK